MISKIYKKFKRNLNSSLTSIKNTKRRIGWLIGENYIGNTKNILLSLLSYLFKLERSFGYPVILKLDINSNCNLRCTVCVHANEGDNDLLKAQQFNSKQVMDLINYENIIKECKGKTSAVSLYYLGDPIVNPNLSKYVKIARDAGMNVHINTNFSVPMKEEKIIDLALSGITHFTACMDAYNQEIYSKTRVGGNIEIVKNNLKSLCKIKEERGLDKLNIEVQFVKFKHNLNERKLVYEFCKSIGIKNVSEINGSLTNYTDYNFNMKMIEEVMDNSLLPKCFWPFFSMVVKFSGDALPCCNSRVGEVYTLSSPKYLGNVFDNSIKKVWNGYEYRTMRSAINFPKKHEKYLKEFQNFCAGCEKVCNVKYLMPIDKIMESNYDDLFEKTPKGAVRKKINLQ